MTDDLAVTVARRYLTALRSRSIEKSRPRSDAYREVVGALDAYAVVLALIFDGANPGMVHKATREMLEVLPIDVGPVWVAAAAVDLVARLAHG